MQASERDAVLENVRRAYRLLYAYQKRIVDLANELARYTNLEFVHWRPAEFQRPCRGGTNPQANWQWDMFPLFISEFYFCSRPRPIAGTWLLGVEHIADSGFVEWEGNGEPDPEKFRLSKETASELNLWAMIVKSGASKTADWVQMWDESAERQPSAQFHAWHEKLNGCDITVLYDAHDVKEFFTEEEAKQVMGAFHEKVLKELG